MIIQKAVSNSAIVLLLFLLILGGCSNKPISDGKIAHISINENSEYDKTFKELHLGVLYDFNMELTEADKTWVTLWVEGYKNGEKTDPFHLIELSHGMHPSQKIVEGPMGFGMINHQSEKVSFFLFAPDVYGTPKLVEDILNAEGVVASMWEFAIGDETVSLESGETKVLGVYRQTGSTVRSYDYQDSNQLAQMIKEDVTVLLLKIKVERVVD